jgi:hypothetical protein
MKKGNEMQSRKRMQGFVAGAVLGAAGIVVFASGAFAGWVIESENDAPKQAAAARAGATGAPKKEGPKLQKFTMKIQDKMARMDAQNVSVIFNSETGEQVVLMHEKKMYLKMSGEQIKEMRESVEKLQAKETPAPGKEPVKATGTGKTDKISGFAVEEYVAQFPNRKVTYWVAREGVDAGHLRDAMMDIFSRMDPGGATKMDFKSLPGYPIRSIEETTEKQVTLPNGKTITVPGGKTTHTVTSIKEEKLGAEAFGPPADYSLMEGPRAGAGGPAGAGRPAPVKKPATP